MPTTGSLTEQAVALAKAAQQGDKPADEAVRELAGAGDKAVLEQARAELVARLYLRTDDYEATAALTLVNKALAAVGWPDPYYWKNRRKP